MEKKGVSSNWRQHDMGFNEVGCVTVNKKKKQSWKVEDKIYN